MNNKKCRCGGDLKKGFYYIRNSDQPIQYNYVVWVEGEKDDITKFMGTKASAPQHPVTPYKCEKCGLIEFYADPVEGWRH